MRTPFPRRRGFTLVEILVATGISVVIVLGVVQIATSSLKAYDNAMAQVSATATARTVLDTLETDIQGAFIAQDGSFWMEAGRSVGNSSESVSVAGNTPEHADQELCFFGTPRDRDRYKPGATGTARIPYKGDVCAIRYRLVLRNPLPDGALISDKTRDVSYTLTRTVVNPEDTFNHILPLVTDREKAGAVSEYWSKTSASAVNGSFADPKAAAKPNEFRTADVLSTNVIGFTPVFIFRALGGEGADAREHFYYQVHEKAFEQVSDALAEGFTAPDSVRGKPTSGANTYTSNNRLKITTSGIGKGNGLTPAAFASDATNTGVTRASGTLCGVIISLIVLDDAGAEKVRAVQNRTGQLKLADDEWEKIYREHTHFFTRQINLTGR